MRQFDYSESCLLLTDPRTYAKRDLYHALMGQLRERDPLFWAEPQGYRPFWVLTKHADIVEVERQPKIFLNAPRMEMLSIEQERLIAEKLGRMSAAGRSMMNMDGEEHLALRHISQGWFMPSNLKGMEEQINVFAKEYVNKLAALGGQADFVIEVSEQFPLNVILLMMGMPASEAPELLRLSHNYTRRTDAKIPDGLTYEDLLVRAAEDIFNFFGVIYDERLKNPTDDVAGVIAHAKINGKPLERLEALSYYVLLGLAGHDTTNGTMSGGLLALIQNPGELAKLKADPSLINTAVDEMLRWVSPTTSFMKTAAIDYQLRGKTVKAGESLLTAFASGNRDADVFEDPFAFKVDRKPNPQLATGHGAHMCLGQHLAKMELRAFFRELVGRLESIELLGEPVMAPGTTTNQMSTLPIKYSLRASSR